eukprot:UN02449
MLLLIWKSQKTYLHLYHFAAQNEKKKKDKIWRRNELWGANYCQKLKERKRVCVCVRVNTCVICGRLFCGNSGKGRLQQPTMYKNTKRKNTYVHHYH